MRHSIRRLGTLVPRRLLAGLLVMWLCGGAVGSLRAQNRILYTDPKTDMVVEVMGAIIDESKKTVEVKPLVGDKLVIPSVQILDIIYAPGKAQIAEEYKKTYEAEQTAARTAAPKDRKKLLGEVVSQYRVLLPKLDNEASLKRHVQYRIAVVTGHAAMGDKVQVLAAIELLEKFVKDHPDSWQSIPAERQLAVMKGKK